MSALPEQLISSLRGTPGFDEQAFRKVHAAAERVTSIRFNADKCSPGDGPDAACFPAQVFPGRSIAGPVPWSEQGYYLKKRPAFFLDPLWHGGLYYVQDASSMCLSFAMEHLCDLSGPGRPLRILDLCAAPGGKSTLMAAMMPPGSLLVSNETIGSRVGVLEENMVKWGAAGVIVTQNDARDFGRLKGYFDLILVDAPCSGSGLFRKDPEAIGQWSEQQVQLCASRQRRILADVMGALKPDGRLIYATCSYSPAEDEQICDYLLDTFPLENKALPFRADWKIVETTSALHQVKGYRFYPDRLAGEGFFLACFRGVGPGEPAGADGKKGKQKPSLTRLNKAERNVVAPWIHHCDAFTLFSWKGQAWALPASVAADLESLTGKLRIVSAGLKVGKIIREELIPSHELAMSVHAAASIPRVELPAAAAVAYLRKGSPEIPVKEKGWLLATYRNHPLGWLKGVGGRFNNYYPTNWRIRGRGDPANSPEE
jgi:16S rRNA C967 or C1407 C5-methylase (RsmB/RsmF family)/NOL1/NOP2/fmu family ribosome biogenesis protein